MENGRIVPRKNYNFEGKFVIPHKKVLKKTNKQNKQKKQKKKPKNKKQKNKQTKTIENQWEMLMYSRDDTGITGSSLFHFTVD